MKSQTASPLRGEIVLVEDNTELSEVLIEMIQDLIGPFRIVCFTNGREALSYLLKNSDSVSGVISDLMMNEMDGIDFLASIRKDERTRALPFLFLSGAELSVFSNLLQGYEFNGFIPKPVHPKTLKTLIENNFRVIHGLQREAA